MRALAFGCRRADAKRTDGDHPSHFFAAEIKRAGMASRCTPHGLRKRCLTDLAHSGKTVHQIMAVSGHLTMSEVERYTRMHDRALNAREAMRGRTENEKVSQHGSDVTL